DVAGRKRRDLFDINAQHETFWSDHFSSHLQPASRLGSKVHNLLAPTYQPIRSDRLLRRVGGSAAVASDSGQPVVLVLSPLLQPGPCHSSAGSLAYARPIRDGPVKRQQRRLVPLRAREERP